MPSAADGPDLSGITLDDRYTLLRHLGRGGMGQVYDAYHQALDRKVAVKVLHPWLASEPKYRERFLREARAASRIQHPNVVELLDFGHTPNDSVYLVMEFLKGRDLKAVIAQEGPLSWPRTRHFLLQAGAALKEAHRHDIIHRDIKPANCFVCDEGEGGVVDRVKLLDFGMAKVGADPSDSSLGARLTQTGELVGTLAYMAPEFADGKPASVASDMYALGIMAYEMLTGRVPFTGRNEFQILARHLNDPPVRPRVLVPDIPLVVERLVLKMLAKKPEQRYPSMAELERALLGIDVNVKDEDGAVDLVNVIRREGSGPREAARREGSGPRAAARREGSGPRAAARPQGSGPRAATRPEGSGPWSAASVEADAPRATASRAGSFEEGSGPWDIAWASSSPHRAAEPSLQPSGSGTGAAPASVSGSGPRPAPASVSGSGPRPAPANTSGSERAGAAPAVAMVPESDEWRWSDEPPPSALDTPAASDRLAPISGLEPQAAAPDLDEALEAYDPHSGKAAWLVLTGIVVVMVGLIVAMAVLGPDLGLDTEAKPPPDSPPGISRTPVSTR